MKQLTGKMCIRFMIFAIFVFGLLMIPAAAQNQGKQSTDGGSGEEASVKFLNESFKVIGTKTGFETKVVRDAPYSATVETENIQTFADGNSIKNKNTSLVYRDSKGRTRRESEIRTKGQKIVKEIFISDPANGINFTLDEVMRQAFRVKLNLEDFKLKKPQSLKSVKPQGDANPVLNGKTANPITLSEKLYGKDASVTELLGKKNIEGIDCEGKRTTLTIPAGAIGNTLPMKIISEEWYSPELQALVLTIRRDLRFGETIYRLTNIKRFEPDKSLFEVPANYTVIDKSEIKKKVRE
jgi:hypothetical protein